ncbi:MAG: capsule assembly Wzi family protein [Culturomica sp.]|nr:capsule assembly Wzi family protein [Culturomica sp.]
MCPPAGLGQEREFNYRAAVSGFLSGEKQLPFWAVSNRHGIVPTTNGGVLEAGIFSGFVSGRAIRFAYGVSAAGQFSEEENNLFIDQLFASANWKKIRLDLGIIHRETILDGLSATNGNILWSGNTRSLPGYTFSTGYIFVPGTKGVLSFKGSWSDYLMNDKRYVKNTLLHNKSLFLRIVPHRRWEVVVGLEHAAQWGGTFPDGSKQPASFLDYLRIVAGREGGSDATVSDQINVLGNHLGRQHVQVSYSADAYSLSFYHDIPFEDGSGSRFQNFPDGTYTLHYRKHRSGNWIDAALYEFHYTKRQSGKYHDRLRTPEEMTGRDPEDNREMLGGNDDYFNNGEYRSGWTFHGRAIGSPLMTAGTPGEDGISPGIFNNRVLGHHIGLKGTAFSRIPYKALLTYTLNYGRYSEPLPDAPQEQFSCGLEATLPHCGVPFRIDLGIYGDFGPFSGRNIGVGLKLYRFGKIGR